jgi:tetratricopeptide (TPR) repeat protein
LIASLALAGPAAAQIVSDHDRQLALRHYRSGEQALQQEAFDQAEREFQEAGRLDPLLELAHYGLGQVYMATRRYPLAVRAYEKCREVFETNGALAMQNEAAYEQRLRDQITALEDARRSLETGVVRSRNAFASVQRLQIQITELKTQLNRKPDQAPPVPAWISLALGSAYFRTSAMPEAEREYRAAIAADPKLGEAHNNLAVVLLLTGRPADAEQSLTAAERAGFQVNPQLKDDIKKAAGK